MYGSSDGMAAYRSFQEGYDGALPSPQKSGVDHSQRHGSSTCSDSGKPVWYSRTLSPYEEQNPNLSTFSYGSLEAYGGDELNQSANIFEELEELRSERLKLSETNDALHRRLKTTEESETELLKKAEEAKKTISSLLQKQTVFKDQMLDLQDEVRRLENNSLSLQNQIVSLEAEKQALMKTVRQMKSEDTEKLSLRKTIASLEDELEKAQIEIESKDIKLNDVVQHRDELIDKVIEENKNYIELYKSHKDLQSAFQAVQIEKGDLEHSEIRPMTSSMDERLIDKNENLLSELRIVVNDSPGPSPICGRISFAGEMMEGFHAMVESMSAEMESLVASQQNQTDQEQIEQSEDGRNRFASLANAALVDRSLTSPLAGRGSLETCKEGESEKQKQDSPRFSEVNKKKLSISLSGGSHIPELPQLSPIKPMTPPASSPTMKSPLLSSTPVVISEDGDRKNNGERTKTEEEIYQQGFEQGVRSQISQELDDLRDQQRALCENLEEIMEAAEDEEEDENEKNSETQPMLKWFQQYSKTIPWSRASRIGRLVLTGTLFILAIISIIGTILPLERCSGGATLLSAPWEEVVRVLGPYTNIYHPRPPPI